MTTVTPSRSVLMSSSATSVSKNISYEKPEHPPGRTATRSTSSSSEPSSAMRPFTLSTAEWVRWKTWLASVMVNNDMATNLSVEFSIGSVPSANGDVARLRVVQRRELHHPSPAASPAHGSDDAFADAAVEVAHELGIRLGELSERAVEELDADRALGGAVAGTDGRLEAEPVELVGEGGDAAPRARAASELGAPLLADLGGVLGARADVLGERAEQAGQQGVGGRVEPQRRCAGRERVEVLRAAHGPPVHRLGLDEPRLAQPVEVETHRVGMEAEAVGEVLGGQRLRRRGELAVHRVPRLVAQRLEHGQIHAIDGSQPRAYFQGGPWFY